MRKIKHISLVLTLAPLLFTGCTQGKISRITPSKSMDSYRQNSLSLTEKSLEKKNVISDTELDKLVALVQRKLAEDKIPKTKIKLKPNPIKLSLVEQLPLVDPSSIEEIEEIDEEEIEPLSPIATATVSIIEEDDQSFNPVDVQNDDLAELTRLVSNEINTDISGVNGVYTTPIVMNDEADETNQIVKMLEEIKAQNISKEDNIKVQKVNKEDDIKVKKVSREDKIIDTAISYLDTKYIWAANGPTAFDCSGFTKYIFGKNGLTIPRYSGNQAKVGIKVSYNELKVGDLVFFDTVKSHPKRKVNHVGIYIGNNKFIHASSAKKKVVITSFKKKKFYENRFLWGRRVVKDDSTYASL